VKRHRNEINAKSIVFLSALYIFITECQKWLMLVKVLKKLIKILIFYLHFYAFFLSLSHHIISKFEYPLAQLTYNP
jgi:hypothetical protein